MEIGNRVEYKMLTGFTGTVVATEQSGNTRLFIVEWDDLCPMTGRRGTSETVEAELKAIQ